MDILLTGSVAYDYLMTFPGLFKEQILPERLGSISLSFLVDSMTKQRGGVSPNIAYGMALLGEKPRVMATVGEDFGDYRTWLDSKGVDTSLMKVVPGLFTASFFATTDQASAQIASFYPGAMGVASSQSLKDLDTKPDLVIVSPNAPDAMMKGTRYTSATRIAVADGATTASFSKQWADLLVNAFVDGTIGSNHPDGWMVQRNRWHGGVSALELPSTIMYGR